MTEKFTTICLLNGFPRNLNRLKDNGRVHAERLLGPFGFFEAAKIFWNLKSLGMTFDMHFSTVKEIDRKAHAFFSPNAARDYEDYSNPSSAEICHKLYDNRDEEKAPHLKTGFDFIVNHKDEYGNFRDFFKLTGPYIDDINYEPTNENLFGSPVYYFEYDFSYQLTYRESFFNIWAYSIDQGEEYKNLGTHEFTLFGKTSRLFLGTSMDIEDITSFGISMTFNEQYHDYTAPEP